MYATFEAVDIEILEMLLSHPRLNVNQMADESAIVTAMSSPINNQVLRVIDMLLQHVNSIMVSQKSESDITSPF